MHFSKDAMRYSIRTLCPRSGGSMRLEKMKAGNGWRANSAGFIGSAAIDRVKQEASS